MRILIMTCEFPPYPGGVGTYCVEIGKAAVALGHKVDILAPDYGQDQSQADLALPFRIIRYAGGVFHTKAVGQILWQLRHVRGRRYDLVHLADWPFVMCLPWVKRLTSARIVASMHGTDVILLSKSRLSRLLSGPRPFENADVVTGNSQYTADLVLKAHPSLRNRTGVVKAFLGVDQYWFAEDAGAASVLSRFGIPPDRRLLLTVARIDSRKGQRKVVAALSRLPEAAKQQVAYVVVGRPVDKDYQEALVSEAKAAGLPVILTGAVEKNEVRSLYKASWLHVMPAEPSPDKIEGFGLTYLEAAAQGLPSLAVASGGVPEVVKDGATGIVLADSSEALLASRLADLIGHPEQLEPMRAAATAWARDFTWTRCADLTYGLPRPPTAVERTIN